MGGPVEAIMSMVALALAAAVVVAAAGVLYVRFRSAPTASGIEHVVRELSAAHGDLAGRLRQIADVQSSSQDRMSERLHAQERLLAGVLEKRLTEVSRRVGDGIQQGTEQTLKQMIALQERLATIDAAQRTLGEVSTRIVSLQEVLSNKQARGAFGEVQLRDLVVSVLPPSAYSFQATISSGKRADCLLQLPNAEGPIVVDAKFPLESYRALHGAHDESARNKAKRAFSDDVLRHVRAIAEKYIVAGETAESALMFLPSEAVYAELHANFPAVVEKSYTYRVWIVSPTTLMATLNTMRAVLRDVRIREQADLLRAETGKLVEDVKRLGNRVDRLSRHFDMTHGDMREIQVSVSKIGRRGDKIEAVQFEDQTAVSEKGGVDEGAPSRPEG